MEWDRNTISSVFTSWVKQNDCIPNAFQTNYPFIIFYSVFILQMETLLEQASTVWEHDYVALMFGWWAPIGMCEDARGGQLPLFLREKQELLSFFLSSVKCACKLWIHTVPDFFNYKWRQITTVRWSPQYTHFHLPSTLLNLPRMTPIWTSSLPGGSRLICVWIASITGDIHAVSSGYQSISDGAESAALMRSVVGTRQPFIGISGLSDHSFTPAFSSQILYPWVVEIRSRDSLLPAVLAVVLCILLKLMFKLRRMAIKFPRNAIIWYIHII